MQGLLHARAVGVVVGRFAQSVDVGGGDGREGAAADRGEVGVESADGRGHAVDVRHGQAPAHRGLLRAEREGEGRGGGSGQECAAFHGFLLPWPHRGGWGGQAAGAAARHESHGLGRPVENLGERQKVAAGRPPHGAGDPPAYVPVGGRPGASEDASGDPVDLVGQGPVGEAVLTEQHGEGGVGRCGHQAPGWLLFETATVVQASGSAQVKLSASPLVTARVLT